MSTKELRKSIDEQSYEAWTTLVKGWSDKLVKETYYRIKAHTGEGPKYLADELIRRGLADQQIL